MKFIATPLAGAYIIEPDLISDHRGFFARTYCSDEFNAHGLDPNLVQCNISFNKKKGTLRGMHFQIVPHEEAKVVRCTTGAIYDVIIDIRPDSNTFKTWFSLELTEENRKMLYIPKGFAHGFQTLKDNSEVFYQMSEFYHPDSARGIRWNDPAFNIRWPVSDYIMSERDQQYALFSE